MTRWLLACILILPAVLPREARGESLIWGPPALAGIIEEGLAQNQEIQSLLARIEASNEMIHVAGSLEDPRIGIGLLNLPTDSFDLNQEPMTQKQIFVAQKIPWFGKLDLRAQQQALKSVELTAMLQAKQFELARKIAAAYYELGLVAKSLETNSRLTEMVEQMLQVTETRYASGMGLQQDVLQAQVELSKLFDERTILLKNRRTVEDGINALLNRESFYPVAPPENLGLPHLAMNVDTLQRLALDKNPWLKARAAEIAQAAVDIELAQKDYWPDMDFKVAYGQREDSDTGAKRADFLSGSVVFKIPLWKKNRQDKKLAASKKKYEAAARSRQNLIRTLPHRVDALVTEMTNNQQNYQFFSDALILQAEQWAQASLAAYEVGKVPFDTLIKAQMRLLRLRLQADRYLFMIYQKRAELEEVLGGALLPEGHGIEMPEENSDHLRDANEMIGATTTIDGKKRLHLGGETP